MRMYENNYILVVSWPFCCALQVHNIDNALPAVQVFVLEAMCKGIGLIVSAAIQVMKVKEMLLLLLPSIWTNAID